MFAWLGRFAYRRRRPILIAWVLLFVVGIALGSQLFGRTKSDLNGGGELSESVQADDRLQSERVPLSGLSEPAPHEHTGNEPPNHEHPAPPLQTEQEGPQYAAVISGKPVDDEALISSVTSVARQLRGVAGVKQVLHPYAPEVPAQVRERIVSKDRTTLIVQVTLHPQLDPKVFDNAVAEGKRLLKAVDAPTVRLGSEWFIEDEFTEQSEKDIQRAEFAALPLIMIALFFILGGLIAASLPLALAVVSIAGTFLVLLSVTYLTDVSIYAVNVATMFGLGLSFDYGLLMVNRFREERAAGLDIPSAVERTTATAGVTIAFSALTVAASLAGMFVFDDPVLRSLGMGGVAVVLVALAAGITLLPALLAVAGNRIKPAKARASDHGYFYRLSRLVQRRAAVVVVLVAVLLAVSALPFLGVKLEGDDYRTLPRGSETRAAYELLHEKFPGVSDEPVIALFDVRADDPRFAETIARVKAIDGVESVTPRDPALYKQPLTVVEVVAEGSSSGDAAQRVTKEIRGIDFGFGKQVTGEAAFLIDYKHSLSSRMAWAFAIIALSTFVLLFLMTGSVLVPVKAILMNILSLGATFGALVWIFQEGHLSGLLGFDSTGALHVVVPVIVFIFAFGLSMDYEVFLLSRIKEAHDHGYDNDAAVAVGLQRTGQIITSAALLIVVVFAGFAAGSLVFMKQMGVGLALAVIVDATIVRSLLVPATMKLLGERNWWAPRPLRLIYDRFGLHEPPSASPAGEEPVSATF